MAKTAWMSFSLSNSLQKSPLWCYDVRCYDVCSVRPPQICQVQAKTSTVRPVFPEYLFVSSDYEKCEYFHVQHTLFATSCKRKYIKNPYTGKKRETWNKLTTPFPNKWKKKLAKSDRGSHYYLGKWINEHEYGKGRYHN